MNKINKLALIILFWLIIVAVLYNQGLITTDFNKINGIIGENPIKMRILFVLLSTGRIILLVPQTIFIIVGSIVFGPYEGFGLSVLSLVISQSIMYIVGKYFQNQILGEAFLQRNKKIINVIQKYGYKILALGVACPVTPSDIITLSAGCIGLNYKKSIATIVMADAPMIFLYGFLGSGIEENLFFKIFAIIVILVVSYYTFVIWNKVNNEPRLI